MRPAVLLWTFFGVLNFAGAANAECVTMNRTADQPYAEYDLVNTCRGSAKVFWTRKGERGNTENGSWFAPSC
jgi:hypothetical protein